MLKKLYLQNIVLVEKALLEFSSGLNIITGETGAGKTAILSAIKQLIGAKTENSLIQEGKDVGIVEGVFLLSSDHKLWSLLEEEGLSFRKEGFLTIRKELHKCQKSRIFINDQLVVASFLKKIGGTFLEILSPSSYLDLFSKHLQKKFLDQFGDIDTQPFEQCFLQKCQLEKELLELQEQNPEKEKIHLLEKLNEIEKVNLTEGEEKELDREHTLLSHAEKLLFLTNNIEDALCGKQESILYRLSSAKKDLEALNDIDGGFSEELKAVNEAFFSLDDLSHTIKSYRANLEPKPQRLLEVEERLFRIEQIKKKYGKDFLEIQKYYSSLKESYEKFLTFDQVVEEKKQQLLQKQKSCLKLAERLSKERKKAAIPFAEQVEAFLKQLNIPYPRFRLSVAEEKMSITGADQISFLFSANRGLLEKPIKECASTGELARVLLSIKTVLAEKENRVVIFDEIDANVGGKTASLMGEKLSRISKKRQVVCITHFVQVAKYGDRHFQVEKKEDRGPAKTLISVLQDQASEFSRMIGK